MQVSIEQLAGLLRRATVTIPSEVMDGKYASHLNKTIRTARIKGFRPGKAPAKLVERHFGEGIEADVANEMIKESLSQVIKEEKIKLASDPKLESQPKYKKGKAFHYIFSYEAFPDIQLVIPNNETIEVFKSELTDQDIRQMIKALHKQQTEWVLSDTPAQNGDQVVIDFKGLVEGKTFDGANASNFQLELGSQSMIPGFEQGLLACSIEDETTLYLKFPKPYYDKELEGKPVEFQVKVHQVLTPHPLENDDQLAEKLKIEGGSQALWNKTKENMQKTLEHAIKKNRKIHIFNKLLAVNDIEVPRTWVDEEIKRLQKNALQKIIGDKAAKFKDKLDLPTEPFEQEASKYVKLRLLLSKAIEKFDIKPNDDQVRSYIDEMGSFYSDANQMTQWVYQNQKVFDEIKGIVVEDMLAEHLVETLHIREVEKTYDEIVHAKSADIIEGENGEGEDE